MSQALYRKYRSRALTEIVGQEHITDTLTRAIAAGHVSHAYLLTGPRGTGKTSIARILAHAINGLPYSDAINLDIIEIDAASNRRIDDIRDLREKVHIAPVSAKYKVYIIDEVHMLTGESFNALLKTLEEPPAHVVFILATTEVHKLPATIISRTQRFALRAATPEKITALLKDISKKENIAITDEALALIAEHGNGSFRDSLSLLDQMMHVTGGNIQAQDVQHALGLAPKAAIGDLIDALQAGDHQAAAQQLAELEAQGSSPSALVPQLVHALSERAQTNPTLFSLIDLLLDVPRAYNPSLKLLSTLMVFAASQKVASDKPTSVAAKVHTPSVMNIIADSPKAGVSGSSPVAPAKKKPVQPVKADEPIIEESAESTSTDAQLETLAPEEWLKVLKAVQKANAPVFSILKQAQPTFNPEKHTLTLGFKYKLHQKKMDDPKVKAALTSVMRSALGGTASIATELNPQAKAPIMSDDPTVTSVAEIMGGGEVVDAEKA